MSQKLGKGPHGGLMVWLMTIIVVSLAAKVDTATANIVVLAISGYAMRASRQ